ncbi:serine/threonine protein kinase [Marinithermofilum abyssi]|uniref:Serine/threonine protein kinase n=1 Tax=Marinithermofilum abyssi TaxID=1571185 RepID=A0A8J2YEN2_9BACL|nr:anti-sigma regulatory factor [Marinithermofilum abyssi]GGE26805.1 serine/threonine protein kinase [Marinithermofilum abyssi]
MRKSFPIKYEWDIVSIRSEVRELAKEYGFNDLDQSRIVQSVSELARNVVHHAEEGVVHIEKVEEGEKTGMRIVVQDCGPGIADVDEVIRKSESPAVSDGFGFKHVRELMDEFSIRDNEGKGTYVEVYKWLSRSGTYTEQ